MRMRRAGGASLLGNRARVDRHASGGECPVHRGRLDDRRTAASGALPIVHAALREEYAFWGVFSCHAPWTADALKGNHVNRHGLKLNRS